VKSPSLCKNTQKALLAQFWHSEVNSWQHCESEDNVGTYRCDARAERQSHARSTQNPKLSCGHASKSLRWTKGQPQVHKTLRGIMVADSVSRYRDEVVPRKRGADRETLTLNAFLRQPLAQVALSDVTTGMVSAYCAERLRRVRPGTLNRELDILRHAFVMVRRDWDVPLAHNAFADVRRPKDANPRERRLHSDEADRLLSASGRCRNPYVRFLVQLALETAMRRGELLNMRWRDVSIERRTLHIPVTKNGHARSIPLSTGALATLRTLSDREASGSERILPITRDAAKMAWKRLVRRAGLVNLGFHDLRHEAISRFFEKGLNLAEVALISGHRDVRMLFRYTHPRPEDVAKKL
jgi:integrase